MRRLERDLAAIMGDGAAFSLMVGVGETYFAAFALAVGLGEVAAGLLASLPILAGAVLQLVTPSAVRRLGSHRRWVVLCARLQALTFLPLVLAAIAGQISLPALFLIAALYWGFGMGTGPAWNTWVGVLVPRSLRTHYFARRTRVQQAALLGGLLLGGAILHGADLRGYPLWGFAAIFALGGLCRLASAVFIARQSEPASLQAPPQTGPLEVLARARGAGGGGLLVYMLALQTGVHVAAPFFTPYMLTELELPYDRYMLLVAASLLAKIAALPLLGRLARRYGARRLLWLGAVGVVPLAGMWIFLSGFAPLLVLQMFAGAAWGAYELATVLLVFDHIPAADRTTLLTLFNLANALAMLAGAALGGVLLGALGHGPTGYFAIFAVSSVARAGALLLLPAVRDVPIPEHVPAMRVLAARPSAGSIERPVVASLDRPHPTETPEDQASTSPG
jgi:MFS family permease